jgi:MFS transporter, DHA1 family, tetracycline resistance protein
MRRSSLLTIFLIVLIDLVGFGIVLPNLQLYGQQYGINNYFFLTLIGATYSFFQFLFAPILGRWSDQIGRRPVLLISQCGTLIGFLMLFSANFFHGDWGIAVIFASRIVNGITGGNISTANAYIADITTPENRAKGMGVIGAAFGLGFVLGPVIGGTVSHFWGLEYVPLVAAAFTITALTMTWFTLAESRTPNAASNDAAARRFSFRGLEHALARPIVGPLIILFFVNGFAFAGMEQTLSLLIQNRIYPIPAAMNSAKDIGTTITSGINNQRRIQDDRASTASGYLFGCIGIMIVLIQGGMIGRLTRRYGELKLALTGPLITAAGLILIGLPISWSWPWTGFLLGGLLLAVGSGIFTPSMQSLISRHSAAHEQGEILGASQGMASLARAVGPLLAGLLFEYLFPAMPYYVSAVLCLTVVLALMLRQERFKLPNQKISADPRQDAVQAT